MSTVIGVILSIIFGFAASFIFAWFIYWLDRYEKEPKLLLGGVFIWGALVAAGGAFIVNTILGVSVYVFTNSEAATDIATTSIFAPLVEETLKGFAVLIVFLLFRHEFDSILDGIVYAAIVALGFAATENSYYIYAYGWQEGGLGGFIFLVFVRIILVGWQHPFYTAFTGIGLAITRLNRNTLVKLAAPIIGWSLAVFTHAFHNTLSTVLPGGYNLVFGALIDWTGWIFMLLFILWITGQERKLMVQHLREEVSLGLITPAQYQVATSAWAQMGVRWNALLSGRYLATARFYQLCAELAHKKQQRITLGEESPGLHSNSAIIERLRADLSRLTPQAMS